MKNLSINKKVFVSIILFIAIQILSAFYFYISNQANVTFAKKEIVGNSYQRTLMKIFYSTINHKILNERIESGYETSTEELKKAESHIDEGFNELKGKSELAAELKFSDSELKERKKSEISPALVEKAWQTLRYELGRTPASQMKDEYKNFISLVQGMISYTGDNSNLILDPDLDSYYMMDVTLLAIPQALNRYSEIESFIHSLMQKQGLSEEDKVQIAVYINFIRENDINRIKADYDTVYREDPNFYGTSVSLKQNTEKLLSEYLNTSNALLNTLESFSKTQTIGANEFDKIFNENKKKTMTLWEASVNELDIFLKTRISSYHNEQLRVLIINVICLILSLVIFYLIINSVTVPLAELLAYVNKIAGREYNFSVEHKDREDEIGKMANAIDAVRITAQKVDTLEKLQKDEEAKRIRAEKLEKILDDFNTKATFAITVVANAATELYETSETMVNIVTDASQKSQSMVQTSSVVTSNVNSVAVAAEEMSASIQEISKQVNLTNDAVEDTITHSSGAVETGRKLNDASNAIGSIIKLIDEIAEQINLLALNATIESARAGEAGKGFAVVASEIKNLADQTTKATENIVEHISKIKGISKQVSDTFVVVNDSVGKLKNYAGGITQAVEEQAQATNEIANNMSSAANDVRDIRSTIEHVSHSNKNAEESTLQVIKAARMLSEQSEKLKLEVEMFIKKVGELKG